MQMTSAVNPFDRIIFSVTGSKILAPKAPTVMEMYGLIETKRKLTDFQLESAINEATEEGPFQDL